ncbi:unnamed protein product [Prunus armeniaca]|uniref:Gnk2-homologous domain-containing protein n=1 Tax=Prunus armeniaca TaxID=36596 RepID=A0A6J5W2U7_PRUAR|nr:unnamed protein product [Prunus armeniaca]
MGKHPNSVNAIALCRGDLSQDLWQACLNLSIERCLVRYPHNLIYGIEKQYPVRYVPGAEFLNNPQPFQPVLDYLLRNCTPDIDEQNCNNCHKESVSEIQTCCGGKQGGRVLKPSCNLSQSLVDIPAPVPAAPAPEEAKKKSNTKQTVIIIVVVLVVFVYFQQHMLFLQSKETKAWRNWREDTVENIIDPVLTRSSWNRSDEIHPHKFTMCARKCGGLTQTNRGFSCIHA